METSTTSVLSPPAPEVWAEGGGYLGVAVGSLVTVILLLLIIILFILVKNSRQGAQLTKRAMRGDENQQEVRTT